MLIGKLLRLGRRQLHTIVSREIIKPSSPTPFNLKTYNLSPLDQLAQQAFMPMILLYPNNNNSSLSAQEKAEVLKKSLSESLTRYYPFSGKLHTPTTPYVNCNDEGVVFVEAKNDLKLDTFQHLSEHDETLDQLFPDDLVCHNSPHSTSLVGVQLNHFACGGVGLAVSLSHLIGDGCTIISFLSHWAYVACYGSTNHKEVQPLNPHIICSPHTTSSLPESHVINKGYGNRVTRKFMFPNSKLSDLKNKVSIKNPTRVEVLTSLLYKSAVAAATKRSGCFKPSYLFMPVDIRKRFVEKLPQTAMGNFVSVMMVPTRDSSDVSLSMLVSGIKNEKMQLEGIPSVQQAADNMKLLESKLINENLDDVINRSYWCSSLGGFPYDKMDFGWGKPTGTTLALRSADRIGFLLMNTPNDDGIEALVILEKEDMEIFENDMELFSYCV